MNDIKLSILETMQRYTTRLQYLAKKNPILIRDLMLLVIVDEVYDWANWMGESQINQLYLQNFRKKIIRNNSEIIMHHTQTNSFYKNVSTPQTLYTWQRVYDTNGVVTKNDAVGFIIT